jgi:hypothetical protein
MSQDARIIPMGCHHSGLIQCLIDQAAAIDPCMRASQTEMLHQNIPLHKWSIEAYLLHYQLLLDGLAEALFLIMHVPVSGVVGDKTFSPFEEAYFLEDSADKMDAINAHAFYATMMAVGSPDPGSEDNCQLLPLLEAFKEVLHGVLTLGFSCGMKAKKRLLSTLSNLSRQVVGRPSHPG